MIANAGVDISARWFDICVLVDDQPMHRQFPNSKPGLRDCQKWLLSLSIDRLELALEPTGRYGELVAEFFYRRKHKVRQVNTLKFSRYAESFEIRGKTDAKDCVALANYCKERGNQISEWKPKTELEYELRDMQLLLRGLTKRKVVLQCQLQCRLKSEYVAQELQQELEQIEDRLDEATARAEKLILAHDTLSRDYELLLTIPGIGIGSAVLMITLIDFRRFRSSRALACFLGLTVKKHQSGSTVRGKERISKRGNKFIRGALFMPARTARQHNPAIREFSERHLARKKHDWCIQVSVIRKLVTTAWAVVVNQVPFDREYRNPNCSPT